jgi:hypothetical protein
MTDNDKLWGWYFHVLKVHRIPLFTIAMASVARFSGNKSAKWLLLS